MRTERKVVVITGASSGIGRATARAFAREGAALCLAARREPMLAEVVDECRAAGAEAMAVPADVTVPESVERIAREAIARFGRIDVWVNNAGVGSFGLFEETPSASWRQVIETNLFGCVHGARAVLPHFRRQGSGVLVNVASLASRVAEPYLSAYCASKHAVRGFSISLRQELRLTGPRSLHVCTVMPASIDTPFFQRAGNYTGRRPRAAPPVYPPERVARTIVRLARRPRPEVFVGSAGRQLSVMSFFMPRLTERLLGAMAEHGQLSRRTQAAITDGNLFRSTGDGLTVSGGWKPRGALRVGRAVGIAAAVGAIPLLVHRLRRA